MNYQRRKKLLKTLSTEDIHDMLDQYGEEKMIHNPLMKSEDDTGAQVKGNSNQAVFYVDKNSQQTLQEEWDSLFNHGNLSETLKLHALDGNMGTSNLRSICWRIFWECLSEDKSQWVQEVQIKRNRYTEIRKKYVIDPYDRMQEEDVSEHHPLSLSEDSVWNKYFQDNELRSTITQDLDRLCPEVEFFKQENIKSIILHILFCYARENPQVSYKQGMHEILATVVYVMMVTCLAVQDNKDLLTEGIKIVADINFIEHDTYILFCNMMETLEPWFTNLQQTEKTKEMPNDRRMFRTQADSMLITAISKKLNKIQGYMLKRYDHVLFEHLQKIEITPQLYGIRWIRLLFGREFSLNRLLTLWDALFADGVSLVLVDYVYLAMLINLRAALLQSDFNTCLLYLMKYPDNTDTKYILKRAIALKQNKPGASPNDSGMYGPSASKSLHTSHHSKPPRPAHPVRNRLGDTKQQKYAQALGSGQAQDHLQNKKITTPVQKSSEKSPFYSSIDGATVQQGKAEFVESKSQYSHDRKGTVASQISQLKTKVASPTQIINRISKSIPKTLGSSGNEVANAIAEDHARLQKQVVDLQSELDKMQSLCLYCGGKMDMYLTLLHSRLMENEEFSDEVSILSIAGMKQVRDLIKSASETRGSIADYDVDFSDIDRHIASASDDQLQQPYTSSSDALSYDKSTSDVLPQEINSSIIPESQQVMESADFSYFDDTVAPTPDIALQQADDEIVSSNISKQKMDDGDNSDVTNLENTPRKPSRILSPLESTDVSSPEKNRKDLYSTEDLGELDTVTAVRRSDENVSFHEQTVDPLSAFLVDS